MSAIHGAKVAANLQNFQMGAVTFWEEDEPSAESCNQLKTTLEHLALEYDWESIVNLTSQAVFKLNDSKLRAEFYYMWLCALKEQKEFQALKELGEHIEVMSHEEPLYLSLGVIAALLSGDLSLAKKTWEKCCVIKNTTHPLFQEAKALFLFHINGKKKESFALFQKLCKAKKSSYFTARNFISSLSQSAEFEKLSQTYHFVHERFPHAKDPYYIAILIAMSDGNTRECLRLAQQLHQDDPTNEDVILCIFDCLVTQKKTQHAWNFIQKNMSQLSEKEFSFDFHAIFSEYYDLLEKPDIEKQKFHLQQAVTLGKLFFIDTEKYEQRLEEIEGGEKQELETNVEMPVNVDLVAVQGGQVVWKN